MFDKLKFALSLARSDGRDEAGESCMETSRDLFEKAGMKGMGDVLEDNYGDMFAGDTRAQTGGASRATNLVVGLVVAGLMAAFLLPIAIEQIANTSTSGWSDGAASLWGVLPIMIVLAIFLFFVGLALKAS